MEKLDNKKRMMYMSGEDFYFFTYNVLLILKELNCTNGKLFKDYRKLPFVVDVISDRHLLDILFRNDFGEVKSPVDRKHLVRSYTNCKIKTSEYLKLLFSLEKQGYVTLSNSKKSSQIDVTLNKESVSKDFFKSEVFDQEKEKLAVLKSKVKRMSSINFETFIGNIYMTDGVTRWAL